jgi:hypothetical protein
LVPVSGSGKKSTNFSLSVVMEMGMGPFFKENKLMAKTE